MKYFILILMLLASVFLIFNVTQVDFNTPFEGESMVAIITVLASLCAIILLLILRTSKQIEQKVKERK